MSLTPAVADNAAGNNNKAARTSEEELRGNLRSLGKSQYQDTMIAQHTLSVACATIVIGSGNPLRE